MEYIKSERLAEGYYKEILSNGLTVLVYPLPGKSAVFAMLSSKVGSSTLDFSVDGKSVSVPEGTAHFLEHKMFENQDGIDAFELFAATGASANAYTSFDRTCYLFETSLNAEQSLKTILGFVGAPYFTEQTVEKEQGIIGQEIKMYLDHPGWRQMFTLLESLYEKHPVKYDLAGSVESIAKITPEMLYDFYNAFYNPSNMVLAVSGNITAEKVIEICGKEFADKDWRRHDTKIIQCSEQDAVVRNYAELKMAVSSPQFCLGYKEIPFSDKERLQKEIAFDMLLDIICGETSDLYRRLYDEGIVDAELSSETLSGDDYLCTIFSGESSDPDKAALEIKKEIERFRSEGIDEQRFTECKRAYIGHIVGEFDDLGSIAASMTGSHFRGWGVYEVLSSAETIRKKELETLLESTMRESFSSLTAVYPL